MADYVIDGDWRCCGPHDTEWQGICKCPCHPMRQLERELAEAEQQLVAQWEERLACPCGALCAMNSDDTIKPHTPNCPTARALERQR